MSTTFTAFIRPPWFKGGALKLLQVLSTEIRYLILVNATLRAREILAFIALNLPALFPSK